MRNGILIALAFTVLLVGCHRKRVAQAPLPPPPAPAPETAKVPAPEPEPGNIPPPSVPPAPIPGQPETGGESGVASWYGYPFHGRASASGEIYDMEQMTAAHRTLPFGTIVRVHDLDTRKSVDVRVNDRGPFVDGRIIDLSHAAARAIDMIGPGTAHVQLEIMSLPASAGSAFFGVQVGAFRNRDNAERLRRIMETKYGRARLVRRADSAEFWRVVVGRETTEDGATILSDRIRSENRSVTSAFVVRLDSV